MSRLGWVAVLLLLVGCTASSTASSTLPKAATLPTPACTRAEAPAADPEGPRLRVSPERVAAGARFQVIFSEPQRWSLSLLLQSRLPCPLYHLRHDGMSLTWERWKRKGVTAISTGRIRPRRHFEALVPPSAPPGTYRLCGSGKRRPCATVTVVG